MIAEVAQGGMDEAAMIHSESWKESHGHFCTKEFVEMHSPERQKEHLQNELRLGKKLFMLTDGKPVGIVTVGGDLIENLYVLPREQGRGYGTRLLIYAMGMCRGVPRLRVLSNNDTALALYKKHGFSPTGEARQISDSLFEIGMRYEGGGSVQAE